MAVVAPELHAPGSERRRTVHAAGTCQCRDPCHAGCDRHERPFGHSGGPARGWVDTGIDVRRGDSLAFDATGSVTLSTNASDIADPSGSRTGRRAAAAPLTDQPAGMLIARIGDAAPLAVGGRQSIAANASGRLYLSVNDDYFDDNRGAFRVMISVGP